MKVKLFPKFGRAASDIGFPSLRHWKKCFFKIQCSFYQKIFLSFILIVLLTIILRNVRRCEEVPNIEGFSLSDFNPSRWMPKITNPIGNVFGGVTDIINKLKDIFDKITYAFKTVQTRAEKFRVGFDMLIYGLKDTFAAIKLSFDTITMDVNDFAETTGYAIQTMGTDVGNFAETTGGAISTLGQDVGHFIESGYKCAKQIGENLYYCFFFYVLYAIGELLYSIIIRLPIYLIKVFAKYDLTPIENMVWDNIYYVDSIFYEISGFHFAHFPDDINRDCFTCKNVSFTDDIQTITDDWNVNIPKKFSNDKDKINNDFNKNIPNRYKDNINNLKTSVNTTIPNFFRKGEIDFKNAEKDFKATVANNPNDSRYDHEPYPNNL